MGTDLDGMEWVTWTINCNYNVNIFSLNYSLHWNCIAYLFTIHRHSWWFAMSLKFARNVAYIIMSSRKLGEHIWEIERHIITEYFTEQWHLHRESKCLWSPAETLINLLGGKKNFCEWHIGNAERKPMVLSQQQNEFLSLMKLNYCKCLQIGR